MRTLLPILFALCLVTGAVAPTLATASIPESYDGSTLNASSNTSDTGSNTPNAQPSSTTLTILSYNDIQTAAVENGTFPRMATLIERRRAAHDNPTVVLGGGDEVSPHSLSPLTTWKTPVKGLNVIAPDAEVIGNHDLDYGFEAVENFSAESEFPWLMANIEDSETGDPIPGTKPYTVIERDGVKVGVIGLADEKIRSKTAVDFDEEGYELTEYAETGTEYATMLKEEKNVDAVVVLGHFGVPVAKDLANRTGNVDAIVVGDDEVEYPPDVTSGTVIMEAEARAEHVAEANLTIQNGEVVGWDGRLLNVTDANPKNETLSRIITEDRGDVLSRFVGRSEVELDARFASNYHDETAYGNLITDAFREETGADVALTNAGGIRSNSIYGPGNITAGDVYNALPFRNSLVTVELSGAELKELLASQIVTLESEEGRRYGQESKLQASGVHYEWNGHAATPPAERIQDVWVNGEPLSEDGTYTVTVNSYMVGWDGVLANATRISSTKKLYGTVTLEYIEEHSPVAPEKTNRIRRVDANGGVSAVTLDGEGDVTVTFDAPDNATAVVDGTYYAMCGCGGTVSAEHVTLDEGSLMVTFDDTELRSLVLDADTGLQVYGQYIDSQYDGKRSYFDHSVFNGRLDSSVEYETTTTEPGTTTIAKTTEFGQTTVGTTEFGRTQTTNGTTTGTTGQPGFGIGVAVVALAGAMFALQRD
ncbi:bifunctional metallophosphatase/5'-nucleotidase [Haladaptatus caseinilyticus]|uniref:bifunctional metallophosphatase/5'-nucleotidase n=1 Tax=Haladaptatus caseinilyticus TaxID=2993314 RepID=UPI00224AC140|nr:5'-nucleotidase C-terminal domain-containing protein [Haladaptatus caseinilyticus]